MKSLPNIALSGASGSGKSTVARHLVVKHGYQRLSPGDICRQITELAFGRSDKTTLNKVNDCLKSIDPFVWINACLRNADVNVPIVFDCMRFLLDWEFFRNEGYVLVRVEAPLNIRSARLRARGQEFIVGVDDQHSGETELDGASFDKIISNTFDETHELLAAIDEWITGIEDE
jgi:cytidylate kinase